MNRYPCANSWCFNNVDRPGQYCLDCQRIMKQIDKDYQDLKEQSRERYEHKHNGQHKPKEEG